MSSEPLPRSEALMEVLPVTLGERGIELFTLRGLAIQVGWHALKHPNEVATGVATEFALRPIVAHSTSWRHEPAKLIVTYLAIVEPPAKVPPMLQVDPVGRAELARGTATRAPAAIDLSAVVEHALRHLAWLQADDEHIRDALPPGWPPVLADYPPEPFRAFEGDWS